MNAIPYGTQIKTLRAIRGWSQHEAARQAGIKRDTLARLETTHRTSDKTKQKLEAAFDVELNSAPIQAAFSILSSDAARADQVRLALAILESHLTPEPVNGRS